MRRFQIWFTLSLVLCGWTVTCAQDFSNKGKDFWVGYGYHVRMNAGGGGSQQMVLYFATEAVTNVTVSIPRLGFSITYPNIPANTIFTTNALPKTGGQDARLLAEGIYDKGIHISSDQPIVAYAHVYDGNVSGATLLFPTATLGKEYYSLNYTQISNEKGSNGWVYAVAVDTGTTVVQVVPAANTLTHPAGVPFTVNLVQGQVLNLMGQLDNTNTQPFTGADLTGTTLKSISSGTAGCKRIAVFSGSGKVSITCTGNSSSADNYMVQAFPKTAWGKRYLTAPTTNFANNFFRVCVTNPATVVKVNGSVINGLTGNFFYEFNTSAPALIEASEPILVAQYITSQDACGNASLTGDPEVIYLSPVEQNIDKVILNSTQNFAITQHYVNVVIRSSAVASFRIDGNPAVGFLAHPRDNSYAYAQLAVSAGKHTLQADSGFNAIAYGYGQFESYGYNAGTNVKDLYQFASVQNQYATVNYTAACRNSPFFLSMTFPYQPMAIKWVFGAALNNIGISDVAVPSPQYDSAWVVNGKQLYRYKLKSPYVVPSVGTFPIRILAENATAEGCSGEQEIDFDLDVYERPAASFSVANSGCISDSVHFTDNSTLGGRSATQWFWQFGDNANSSTKSPAHLYTAPGTYTIKLSLVSDIGCLSDTASQTVAISDPPVAKFGVSTPTCLGRSVAFTDSSYTTSSSISIRTWDFGDNSAKVVTSSGGPQVHTYTNAGTFVVTLLVENATGCKSVLFSRQVTVSANPVPQFSFGNACLPGGALTFTNASAIPDGTAAQLTYAWDFGEGGTSTEKDPVYNYKAVGPFAAKLVVRSVAGCMDSIVKTVSTIYEQPLASFTASAEVCAGATASFTDASSAPKSTVAGWEWNFGDGSPVATVQNPTHLFAKGGTYAVTLKATSAIGCPSAIATRSIVVHALPTALFTVAAPVCETAGTRFTNVSTAGSGSIVKSVWDFGDGGSSSNEMTPTHTYANAGTYNVTLLVETDKGCKSNPVTSPVVVHPLPKVGFVVPGNCINDPVSMFTDTTSIADGNLAQAAWLWNFGDPNASAAANASAAQNGQHHYTATGDYNVSLKVTSKDGCLASLTQVFTVNGAVPVPLFTFKTSLRQCSNDSVVVIDNSTVAPGRLVRLEVYWDYNGDPTNKLVVEKPVPGQAYAHVYPTFFSPVSKTYKVKFVVYSGINCLTEKDTTLNVLAVPEIRFDIPDPFCMNVPPVQLSATALNMAQGMSTYSGKGVLGNGLFNPAAAGAGDHLIRYTYTGANGCTSVKETTIRVFPVPVVDAGPNKVVLEGGSTVLGATAGGNNLQYLWTPSSGLSSAVVLQPVASPVGDVTYTLAATSADGCTATDTVSVKMLKTPTVPNAFSPNGDGVHDKWDIQYLDSYPGATMQIFNRYGQKVFESKGYAKPWDGTANGKPLPVGTYYYIIDPKNGRKPLAGFVDIIR